MGRLKIPRLQGDIGAWIKELSRRAKNGVFDLSVKDSDTEERNRSYLKYCSIFNHARVLKIGLSRDRGFLAAEIMTDPRYDRALSVSFALGMMHERDDKEDAIFMGVLVEAFFKKSKVGVVVSPPRDDEEAHQRIWVFHLFHEDADYSIPILEHSAEAMARFKEIGFVTYKEATL